MPWMLAVLWVFGTPLPLQAAVLCQKKSGAVLARDSACKKKEKQLDLAPFGAAGDATRTAAVASVDFQNTPTAPTGMAMIRVGGEDSQGCPANSIAIVVRRHDNTGGSDIAFNVVVP